MTTTFATPQRRPTLTGWGWFLVVAVLAEVAYFSLTTTNFAGNGSNLLVLAEQFAPTGLIAVGLAMVVLTGSIDLSVGATASLSAIVAGLQLTHGHPLWWAVLLAVLVAVVVGIFNGLVVAVLGIDSLLVTLATQFIVSSLGVSLAGNNPPYAFSTGFQALARGTLFYVPYSVALLVVVGALAAVVVTRTTLGRSLTLIGYNPGAATYSGLRTRWALVIAFTISGALAGVAGVLLAAYYDAARSNTGTTLLLPAVTAVVLGGVDIFGGRGRIGEVVLAVLLLGWLDQGLLISGVSALAAQMATGGLLIIALVVKVNVDPQARAALRRRLDRLRWPGSRGVSPTG